MIDASVAVQTGPNGTTVHACARCGQTFWFASLKPSASWTCCYCAEEIPPSARPADDTRPGRCSHCRGTGLTKNLGGDTTQDICEYCAGSGTDV